MSVLSLLSLVPLAAAVWFFIPKLLLHATVSFAVFLAFAVASVINGDSNQFQYIALGGLAVTFTVCVARLIELTVRR